MPPPEAAQLVPADNRAFELAALERGQAEGLSRSPPPGAGRSLNPPPGSTSAIAFCSRISTGNFPLRLQDRNTFPKCGSIATTSRNSLPPDSVREPQTARCQHPAGSFFASEQGEAGKYPIYGSFSCRCCTVWVVPLNLLI